MADRDREEFVTATTALQVCNADLYEQIMEENPLLAKYMMEKFIEYLSDTQTTKIERQTMLMNFLLHHTCYELIDDVIKKVSQLEFAEDYKEIILEWTFHNSEDIVQINLESLDAEQLIQPIEKPGKLKLPEKKKDDKVDAIVEVKVIGLEDQPEDIQSIEDIISALLPKPKEEGDDGESGSGEA